MFPEVIIWEIWIVSTGICICKWQFLINMLQIWLFVKFTWAHEMVTEYFVYSRPKIFHSCIPTDMEILHLLHLGHSMIENTI